MKKYTSAVLLALNLTWKSVLAAFLVNIALQIFFGLRIIMPSGIPVTAAFVFEWLLGTSVRTFGKWGFVLLLGLLVAAFARARGSKSIYTLNRLGLSEQQITFVFCFVFTGYFLLYWALQLAICYGFFLLFDHFAHCSPSIFMQLCWKSRWLHLLLPMNEWWGYLRNAVLCLSFGFCTAFGTDQMWRGKFPLLSFLPVIPCFIWLSGEIGALRDAIWLMVMLSACPICHYFALKGVWSDDDL